MAGDDEIDLKRATGNMVYQYFMDSGTTGATNTPSSNWISRAGWEYDTPHAVVEGDVRRDAKGIHPRLYFKYVKSKLSMLEERTFKARMKKLEQMQIEFAETGQEAMSDECIKQFIVLTREAAVYACGLKTFILPEHLEKFRYHVKGKAPVTLTPLKNFTRKLPVNVAKKVKLCIDKKLFDDYIVAHLDQKDDRKETEKEKKERERDPILFGRLQNSDKYYFIIDWEDEQDDLRLSDIVTKLSLKHEDITLSAKVEMPVKSDK